MFFFSARLVFDYPADPWPLPELDRGAILAYVAKTFLFVIDVLIVIPTVWLFVRFVSLEPLTKKEIEEKMKVQLAAPELQVRARWSRRRVAAAASGSG